MVQTLVVSTMLAVVFVALCSFCEAVLTSIADTHFAKSEQPIPQSSFPDNLGATSNNPITAISALSTFVNTICVCVAGAAAVTLFTSLHFFMYIIFFALTLLVVSEIFPRLVGTTYSYQCAAAISLPARIIFLVEKPFIALVQIIFNLFTDKATTPPGSPLVQGDTGFVQAQDELLKNEKEIINNTIELKNKIVRQVMTPRTVTFSLNEHITVGNAVSKITEQSIHSRIPIYSREPNNITGFVLYVDILQAAAEGKNKLTMTRFKHPAHFVPETAPLNRILADFFDRRQHLFIVVDEYGTMTGIISLEDVLEEIVGMEIIDESDKARDMRELARNRNIETRKKMKKQQKNQLTQ